ncbi:MAG: hypothetical protein ACPG31_01090 [Planctomycetota bacterium]
MAKLLVVHWRPAEAEDGIALLQKAGHAVEVYSEEGGTGLGRFKEELLDAVVISLERLPSHGRTMGHWFRTTKATAHVPLVFVGGADDKVEVARAMFADAIFTPWSKVRGSVKDAMRTPQTAMPNSECSTKEVWQKLEVKAGDRILQLNGPTRLKPILGASLPTDVKLSRRVGASAKAPKQVDLVLLFAERLQDIKHGFPIATAATAERRPLWICWPKKTSSIQSDVTQAAVMAFARGSGWTDTKICRIDEDWSAHMFRRKRNT